MHLLFDPEAWASLFTLTALEIVLGVDNVVVLALLTASLQPREARLAKQVGLSLAVALRLLLLTTVAWITHLTAPVFVAFGEPRSWRNLILIAGGLFLIGKATQEIHDAIEGAPEEASQKRGRARFAAIIVQIAVLDLVFSLDSIVTAVGLARDIWVMAAAVCISVVLMYFAAAPVGAFLERHPTTKMLALCFLILIGTALTADGLGFEVPRGTLDVAMAFAALVEACNVWARRRLSSLNSKSTGGPAKAASSPARQGPRPAADKAKKPPPPQRAPKSKRRRRK